MNWYYAENNQQKGPFSEVEMAGYVTAGMVTDETLVWHEGLPQWRPYGQVKANAVLPFSAPPVAAPAEAAAAPRPGQTTCAECGRIFPEDQTIRLGSVTVCAACKPAYLQKVREGVAREGVVGQPPGAQRYGGFWIRLVAKFVDGLILVVIVGVPVVLLLVVFAPKMFSSEDQSWEGAALQLVLRLGSVILEVAFNSYFIGRFGATPGKMAVGLKVIVADGAPPSYARAFGRAWAEQLSSACCLIGYVIAAFDDQKRALHDHICNTRVVFK